jgi:hypothetical protein
MYWTLRNENIPSFQACIIFIFYNSSSFTYAYAFQIHSPITPNVIYLLYKYDHNQF